MENEVEIQPTQQTDGSIHFNVRLGDIVIGTFYRNGSNFIAIFFGTRTCKRETFADRMAAARWIFSTHISSR